MTRAGLVVVVFMATPVPEAPRGTRRPRGLGKRRRPEFRAALQC
jgi:hypothetical protein